MSLHDEKVIQFEIDKGIAVESIEMKRLRIVQNSKNPNRSSNMGSGNDGDVDGQCNKLAIFIMIMCLFSQNAPLDSCVPNEMRKKEIMRH